MGPCPGASERVIGKFTRFFQGGFTTPLDVQLAGQLLDPGGAIGEPKLASEFVRGIWYSTEWDGFEDAFNKFGYRGDFPGCKLIIAGVRQAIAEDNEPTNVGVIICIGKARYANYQDSEAGYCHVS